MRTWPRTIACASVQYTVRPGELFLITSGTAHRCLCSSDHAYRVVCIEPELLPAGGRFSAVFQDHELAAEVRTFHQAMEDRAALALRRNSLLRMIDMLFDRHRPDNPDCAPEERQAIGNVRTFIHSHFDEKCSLETFAAVADLSPCHLQRVFRKEVGVSPQDYLARHRVRRAAEMLQLGKSHVETALACGFTDQSHLIRVFKRYCGLSPQNYLQQNQGNGLP